MRGIVPLPRSAQALANFGGNMEIAAQLNAAAMDGDEARMRELLAQLLHCRHRGANEKSRQLAALEDLFVTLHAIAVSDDLTGLYNRRGFLWMGARVLQVLAADARAALLIYVDVDNLKYVNDSSGHFAGDLLLRRTAQVLRDAAGRSDIVGRLGGDEFAVLTTFTDVAGHEAMLHRIQSAIDACGTAAQAAPLSLSIGFASFDPHEPACITALLDQADRAMYQDKLRKSQRPRTLQHSHPEVIHGIR